MRARTCRTLGLKSAEEWNAWSKSGDRPHDIPILGAEQ